MPSRSSSTAAESPAREPPTIATRWGAAEAIATNLGILTSAEKDRAGKSFTGKELDEMSESQRTEVLKRILLEGFLGQ